MSLVPAFVRRRLAHRPNLLKILDNIGWLFLDKVLRMGVGLLVGVWVARYLGPEQFGMLNFALAFTALFAAIASMGLQGIVVRDLVRDPQSAGVTLGTAAVLQLIGGLVSYLLILAVIAYLRPDDPLARTIVGILGAMNLFKASEIAVYWFEAHVQSKYTVWVQNGVFLFFAAVKLALILLHAPLTSFVWATLTEAGVVAVVLLMVFGRVGHALKGLQCSFQRARALLKDSWPLVLSGIAVTIYMKIDQIMLGQMIGNEAVGIYSAASKITEIFYFVPVVVTSSLYPSLISSRQKGEEEYFLKLQTIFNLMALMSLLIAIPISVFSLLIINTVYGNAYNEAAGVLNIHIWTNICVFIGTASSNWFIIENLNTLNMIRIIISSFINIVLNFVLIPYCGVYGAALSTLLTFIFSVYIVDLLDKRTLKLFSMKTRALSFTWLW